MSSLREAAGEDDWLSTMLMAMRNDMNKNRILVLVEARLISVFSTRIGWMTGSIMNPLKVVKER